MKFSRYFVLIFWAGLLIACSGLSVPEGKLERSKNLVIKEYRIGIGDVLAVNVWKNPDLSVSVPVRPDGKISVPLVGDVQAFGSAVEPLAMAITERLSKYIKNPQVTIVVTQPLSAQFAGRVRVTGAVRNQISVNYSEGMTVLDLLLSAGGITEFAAPNKARLYRTTDKGVKVYPVYVNDLLQKGKLQTNYDLQPLDIITVPERMF